MSPTTLQSAAPGCAHRLTGFALGSPTTQLTMVLRQDAAVGAPQVAAVTLSISGVMSVARPAGES